MYPPNEKRTTFNYNEIPMQISGLGQYSSHPDYDYLEGRKLEDVYPSGFKSTWDQRFLEPTAEVLKARQEGGPK